MIKILSLFSLITICFGCSQAPKVNTRKPANNFVIHKTNKYPEAFKVVDVDYDFNNLEERDFFYSKGLDRNRFSPRFAAIKFLSDYKDVGYKVCPDEKKENKFIKNFSFFKPVKYLDNPFVKEGEGSFFIMKTVAKVKSLIFFKKTDHVKVNVLLPYKNITVLNQMVDHSLKKAQVFCKSCDDTENISLGVLYFEDEEDGPVYVLKHQTADSLTFVSELGEVKIIPDFNKCSTD